MTVQSAHITVVNNTFHIHPSVRPSVPMSVCLSSVCLSVHLSVCRRDFEAGGHVLPRYFLNYKELARKSVLCPPNTESLTVPPPISKLIRGPCVVGLSVCPSVCPSVCLSVGLSICLSVRLSVCPSLHLSVHQAVYIRPSVYNTVLTVRITLSIDNIFYGNPMRNKIASNITKSVGISATL